MSGQYRNTESNIFYVTEFEGTNIDIFTLIVLMNYYNSKKTVKSMAMTRQATFQVLQIGFYKADTM